MAYPTSTLYAYRVVEVPAIKTTAHPSRSIPRFIPQFTGNGTTWRNLTGIAYQSVQEAYNKIASVVSDEVQFKAAFLAGNSFVPAADVVHAYPPA